MYSWGKASDGQLGLGGIQENIITSPRWNKHVALKSIQHVACGSKHTLLLTDGGVVHSCGSNEKGQLGQDETSTRPSPVISLETRKITHVCCGYFHCVALDDQGQLFTWGGNKFGQLGNEKGDTEVNRVPKSVSALIGKQVVQVACGANHILALVKDGRLYSWGDNSDGQLGHTHGKPHVSTPAIVDSLIDLPMVKIAAGRAHNTVLTVGGGVVTWGRNNFGQLGVEVKADVHGPVEIKDLRKEKVKFVSCGDEHTALLTEDGCVFTFGSNSYGQLGHDNTRNLSTPTKVKALEGREVCQVACGRMHTLILVKESCELFSFGLGANGQLGHGATTNSLKPCSLEGDYWTASGKAGTLVDGCSMEGTDVDTPRILKGIFAGGDQSFVTIHKVHLPDSSTCTDEPMDTSTACTSPPLLSSQTSSSGSPSTLRDDRIVPSSQIPYCITGHMITNWFDELTEENSNIEEIVHNLRIVFSSPSSLNASFLRPNSDHPTTEEHCGVDLVAVKDSFNLLLEKFILPQHSRTDRNPLEEWLMSSVFDVLPATPVSLECCNLYYLLPIFIGKPQSKRMLLAYMKSFLKLDSDKKNALGNWFFNGSLDYVKLIIGMIKNGIVEEIMQSIKGRVVKFLINRPPQRGNLSLPDFHTLCASGEEDSMVTVLSFLQLFHKWNRARHEPLSYKVFHLNHLNKIINFLQDYLNLIGMALSADRLVFCKYPFVLDEDSKSQLLEVECRIQQHIAVLSQGPLSLENMLTEDRVSFLLTVSRDNLVNGTLSTLVSASETELKKPLRVVFADEEGQDDGGIRKEFFMLIFSQILNPDFGMFVEDEESHLIWFREHELFYENVDFYVLIGILCGLAMYNQVLVDLPFPILLYKKLLERAPSVEELKEFRPSLGQNLDAMISYTGDDFEDIYDLTFTVNRVSFGEVSSVDLIPNGSNIKVTKERCHEYVKTYLQYLYHDSVKEQFEAFKRGFMKVCYGKVIEMLHPCELQALMVGNHVTNWKTLEEHMLYLNGYSKDHPTIKFFWEVFHEFSEEAKRKFLVFFTGSDRIPYAGVESMRMIIQRMDGGPGCSKLPVAHTCFNVLDLPPYSTKAQLKEKLLQAIHFTSGFGII